MESRPVTRRKVIVLIPTRNRPQYLNLTVKSIVEQATRHGHDVEIVISDTSDETDPRTQMPYAKLNERAVKKLHVAYKNVPIHYYPPGMPKPISGLLGKMSSGEKRAFAALAPSKGEWGAHRNRLALLAVYHGGENAAYLHLDDDSPLLQVMEGKLWKGKQFPRLTKLDSDGIGLFLQEFEKSRSNRKKGFGGFVHGVWDAIVSAGTTELSPVSMREFLSKNYIALTNAGKTGFGQGRILSFEAMKTPYRPYGRSSDFFHTLDIGGLASQEWQGPDKTAMVAHIGVTGSTPTKKTRSFENLPENAGPMKKAEIWSRLVEKMARLKRTTKN